jgi:hypothetical protein
MGQGVRSHYYVLLRDSTMCTIHTVQCYAWGSNPYVYTLGIHT